MYRVTKEIRFCYGHRLLRYGGPCRHLHGHNGKLEVTLAGEELDERHMLVDFDDVKRAVKTWVDENLDHRMLLAADDPILPKIQALGEPCYVFEGNPTAENICRVVFGKAREAGLPVVGVRLWETDTSWAEYRPEA